MVHWMDWHLQASSDFSQVPAAQETSPCHERLATTYVLHLPGHSPICHHNLRESSSESHCGNPESLV
jgi:hypothetical protein